MLLTPQAYRAHAGPSPHAMQRRHMRVSYERTDHAHTTARSRKVTRNARRRVDVGAPAASLDSVLLFVVRTLTAWADVRSDQMGAKPCETPTIKCETPL